MARLRKTDTHGWLRRVPLFSDLSARQLAWVASRSEEIHAGVGRRLATQDQPGRQLFVIVEGGATVIRDGRTIATLGPGDHFGEMSLLDGEPRSATVAVTEPSVLLVITATAFRSLVEEHPAIALGLLRALSRRLRAADAALVAG